MLSDIGVTATRRGLTQLQMWAARGVLENIRKSVTSAPLWLHHGDCRGGDMQLADVAHNLGYKTVAHPPKNPMLRGYHPSDDVLPAKDYLPRDKDIVKIASVVLACPAEYVSVEHSGTWFTVSWAIKKKRPIVLIYPDGKIHVLKGAGGL